MAKDDKKFRLVNPTTGVVRRDSDKTELRIILEDRYRQQAEKPTKQDAAVYAINGIEAIKSASPEVCELTQVTSVCYQ